MMFVENKQQDWCVCVCVSLTNQVQLTWDETDHERVTALNRNFNKNELLHMDFNAYLASSSEEEGDEEGGFEFGEEENDDDGVTAGGETEVLTQPRCFDSVVGWSSTQELWRLVGVVASQTDEPVVELQKKPQSEDDKKKQKKKKSEEQILKYRELLKGIQEKEKKLQEDKAMEMEISWVPGTTTPFHLQLSEWEVVLSKACWRL